MTVAQAHVAIARLLNGDPPRLIARDITRQLRRNEQARWDRWQTRGLRAPRRKRPS
jgi:hypothetical protein